MKLFNQFVYGLILLTVSFSAVAQDKSEVPDLVKQGIQLNDQGNYSGAIEKYNEALKLDPVNVQASYEMGFSLFLSGKGNDGIPYVEKVINGSTSLTLTAASYDLLGSIYDQGHQSAKVTVPDGLLQNINDMKPYFELSYQYASSLKPKPTSKGKKNS